ncbi:MAG: LamG-like jellyroll fold domain-containing protein [Bacteroidia bacterium]
MFTINYHEGSRTEDGLIVYYDFSEGQGDTIYDRSGNDKPIDLLITEPTAVKWLEGIGLSIESATVIESIKNENELTKVAKSSEMTIEAWVKPANDNQNGPARIVSFSKNSTERNFTLGQDGDQYIVRFRTKDTGDNGMPNASTIADQVSENYIQHLVYTWTEEEGEENIFLDGVNVYSGTRTGQTSNWESSFQLLLGNEADGSRAWLGELYQLAIYDKVLSEIEIQQNFEAEFANGKLPIGNYDLGKTIDTYFEGINNNIPVSLTIPDPSTIDSMIVELVYKKNAGGSLSFADANGNIYTAAREQISGVYVYRTKVPPTNEIIYSHTTNQSSAQSLMVYAYRSGNENLFTELMVSDVGGSNSLETFSAKIPATSEAKNLHLVLPITELTFDNRTLNFTARAGTVDTSFTVKWGPAGRGFSNGCCLDFVEIDLLNVAGHVAQMVVSIESEGSRVGQSYALAGIMTLEISPNAGGTFPLEWLGVDAVWEGTNARINWATFAEENTDYFVIERATASQKFTAIGQIAAQGSIDTETSYNFLDQDAGLYNEIYYRIRQVDLNGAYSMSDQLVLMSDKLAEINMRIGPNPTRGLVNISLEGGLPSEIAFLQLIDLNGKILKEEKLSLGQKTSSFDLANFSAGLYIVRYTSGEYVLNKRIQKN